MIKVKYTDYSCSSYHGNKGQIEDGIPEDVCIMSSCYEYEKLIEGNLPAGLKRVEASYDGGRGAVYIDDETVLDDLSAGDYSVDHKGVSISVDRGRFYFGAGGVDFEDLSAGSDFSFIFEQQ